MFSDYFGLSQDQGVLKRQLGWRTKRIIKKKHVEERDTQSIDSFMARIGLEGEANEETIDDVESTIPVDKDSAREMFPSMLDDLEGPDPFTEDEEDKSSDESEENEE